MDNSIIFGGLIAFAACAVLIASIIFGKKMSDKTKDAVGDVINTIEKYDDFVAQLLIDRGLPEDEVNKYLDVLEDVLTFAKSTDGTSAERVAATKEMALEAIKMAGLEVTESVTEVVTLICSLAVAVAGNIK